VQHKAFRVSLFYHTSAPFGQGWREALRSHGLVNVVKCRTQAEDDRTALITVNAGKSVEGCGRTTASVGRETRREESGNMVLAFV
jgi:hypothetical protein